MKEIKKRFKILLFGYNFVANQEIILNDQLYLSTLSKFRKGDFIYDIRTLKSCLIYIINYYETNARDMPT